MDNFEETTPENEQPAEVLFLTEDIRSYIYMTARWARFLAVTGMIFAVLTAFTALSAGAVLASLNASNPGNPLSGLSSTALTAFYLLLAGLQFYPSFQLYKFSTAANQAVLYLDQASLSAAMEKLKSFFKFWGILVMTFIALYILMIVFVVLGTTLGHTGA